MQRTPEGGFVEIASEMGLPAKGNHSVSPCLAVFEGKPCICRLPGQPLAKRVEAAMYAGRELSVYNLASRREEEIRKQAREVYDYVLLNTTQDCSTYGNLGKRWSCVCDYLEAYLELACSQGRDL